MKATTNGKLNLIPDCEIKIPGAGAPSITSLGRRGTGTIPMYALPDISDTKSAIYNTEGIMGRAAPLYTYSHSGDRNISMQLHFFIINPGDGDRNLHYLRMLESAVYPRMGQTDGEPYRPPPVCQIKCGKLLATRPVCAVLQSYSVKFPTEVAWEAETYCPFRFDVDTNWIVVYTSSDLPYQNRIVTYGN